MKHYRSRHALLLTALLGAMTLAAQTANQGTPAAPAATDDAVRKNMEDYLRNLYAWGPDVKLTIGALKDADIPGLLMTTVDVAVAEQKDSAKLYVSRDGKFMFRGEVSDLSKDPLAQTRAKMILEGAPTKGDPKAPVTLVEYADFECPMCKQLHDVLRVVLPNYPQARLVFKDFPLSTIHPWARTASIAGRCAYSQDPQAFWKLYDAIYTGQEIISAENAWAKMLDYAAQAGLNSDTFKSCMASPEAAKAIDDSFENGRTLEVTSTPTIFVNGRRMIGADRTALEQSIQYELNRHKPKGSAAKP